jgi:serine/threonine protein phosphatase PrpC
VAALAVEEGMQPAVALSLPGGHAITAWLGADAPDPAVHLATHPVRAGDLVLACSDGLWNYAPTDESLADQVAAALPPSTDELAAAKVCEQLVAWANGEGGSDNICVALAPVAADDEEEAS